MSINVSADSFDYSKLVGKIIEKFGSRQRFADEMKTSATTMSRKLNGKAEWSQREMILACECLDIDNNEIPSYFFSRKS